MLPEALSNGLCSLRPDEDHLTFSVFADINNKGKAMNVRFAKTIIRSKARLTYKEAFARLQKPAGDELSRKLHLAWEMASLLRKKRFADGSLDTGFPGGQSLARCRCPPHPAGKGRKRHLPPAHRGNDAPGKRTRRPRAEDEPPALGLPCSRRPGSRQAGRVPRVRHVPRDEDRRRQQAPRAAKLLAAIRGRPQEYSIKLALLKSLKRARYLPDGLGHYGLHKADYTHFTSPIRRYADLIVHRSLERRLGLTNKGPDSGALGAIAEHISTTERTAADAEKESVRLKKLEYFQSQIEDRKGQSFTAQIIDVRNFGIIVELPDFLLTGMIHVSALEGDFYIFDQGRSRLVGRKTRKIYQTGQSIEVIVARVDFF